MGKLGENKVGKNPLVLLGSFAIAENLFTGKEKK